MFELIRIYGIRNKRTKEWWVADSGKYKWFRAQDAKGAYWSTEGSYFRGQDEYEIIEFKLIEVDKAEERTNLDFRKRLGLKI